MSGESGIRQSAEPYKYYLDASVSYFSYYDVATEIYNYNPEAKIIIMLRDPIKRLVSYYKMYSKRKGLEISLERFINDIDTALPKLETGLYYEPVKKYLDLFGTNVHIIIFEELLNDPYKIQEDLKSFLGLSILSLEVSEVFNQSKEEKVKIISKFIHEKNLLKNIIKRFIPSRRLRRNMKKILLNLNEKSSDILVEMNAETHLWLKGYYEEDIDKLKNLLNRPITQWKDFND